MGRYLGLDLGSTSVTAVVIDTEARALAAVATRGNDAELTTAADRARGRSEWDFERMLALSMGCAREACEGAPPAAIGVTGQQKGCQLLAADGAAIGPYIGWQDRRTAEPAAGGGQSWLDLLAERGGAIAPRVSGRASPTAGARWRTGSPCRCCSGCGRPASSRPTPAPPRRRSCWSPG